MRRRRLWFLVVLLVWPARAAHGQCPDGAPRPCKIDSNAVVFAPFVVSGPPSLSYLATSLAELFQTAFDGAGGYRGVQTTFANRELRALPNPSDMAAAAPVARAMGAGLIVGGSIASTSGTDVRLSVELYDAVRKKPVVRLNGVRGNIARLGRMVDSLAFVMSSKGARAGTVDKAKTSGWGTLVDGGKVVPHQIMLMTDFRAPANDSSTAAIAKEALGVSLRQAAFVRVMPPTAVAEALRRMRRQPNEPLTLAVARELAQREGIAIVVDGELSRRGSGTELIARVVAAESGLTLALLSTPISSSGDLLETMDLFGRRLRSKIGESIQTVQAAPPLNKVTTASTEALLHFERANRAWHLDNDPGRAVEELKRAVTIDTSFAAAWRMLGTAAEAARLSGRPVVLEPQFQNPLNHAFAQRAQATEEERLGIEGTYYTGQDLEKARIAYVALRNLNGESNINLGFVLNARREFAAAESVYRAAYVQPEYLPDGYEDFIISLMNQGKGREADSVARLGRSRFPNHVGVRLRAGQLLCGRRMFRECELAMDSVIASGASTRPQAIRTKAVSAMYQGQVERSHRLEAEIDGPLPSATAPTYAAIAGGVYGDLRVRRRPDRALVTLNGIVDRVGRNDLLDAAVALSEAGAPEQAKALLARWEEVPANARTNPMYFPLRIALASIAQAERRYQDAIAEWKNADVNPANKRANPTAQAMPLGVAAAYDSLQMRDSAIVWYERTLATPNYMYPQIWHPAMRNPGIHERLGQLYEAQGNGTKAIEHYALFTDLWKDADADLQPRVADARNRLARLRAERPRPDR